MTEAQFNQLFPGKNPFYQYRDFVEAANSREWPGFARTGSVETQKRELAAALANFKHETGGFVYVTEIEKADYCGNWGTPNCACEPGKRYYGRGPIQLSWNGNYCTAGAAIGLDLRKYPELVENDPVVAWKTAIWFWMTATGAGSMTSHDAMVTGAGFGETIRAINGALECNGGYPDKVQRRIDYYREITNILGVSPGGNLGC